MSFDDAVAIAAQGSRDDVLAYADEVQAATMTFLDGLTDAGLDLGYCARVGEVDVRFVAPRKHSMTMMPAS